MSNPNTIAPQPVVAAALGRVDLRPRGRHQHEPPAARVGPHRWGPIAVASGFRVCVTCGWCYRTARPVCRATAALRERGLAGYLVVPPPRAVYRRRTP